MSSSKKRKCAPAAGQDGGSTGKVQNLTLPEVDSGDEDWSGFGPESQIRRKLRKGRQRRQESTDRLPGKRACLAVLRSYHGSV